MAPDMEALFRDSPVGHAMLVAAEGARTRRERWLLAVSGGRDSMVLLDAAVRSGAPIGAVATFDHGTGPAARRAAAHVERTATRLGVAVVSGVRASSRSVAVSETPRDPQLDTPRDTEALWRDARRDFLFGWAREFRARIVTAHSRDDQIETVAMRILRGSGVRGLAAMDVDSGPLRPLLAISRPQIASYAVDFRVRHVEDPSNAGRDFLRNRVRHDLLPAFERVSPGFGEAMLAVADQAAAWRREVERIVDRLAPTIADGALVVRRSALAPVDATGLAVLWPALAARVGVTLDRRGTERLAAFTRATGHGGAIPLSGGATLERTAISFILRPPGLRPPEAVAPLY